MKECFYYILAAISGGVVSEINKPINPKNMTVRHIFTVGMTSVIIGIVFGLSAEYFIGSVKLAIAVSALAGVGGYSSLQWATLVSRRVTEQKTGKSPENG